MDLNQQPTPGSSACDHKRVKSTPEKRVWPESNSTLNAPVSSCEAKRRKSDMLAAPVKAVTGAQSEKKMLQGKVPNRTSKQCTAELAKQPNKLKRVILQLKKERDFHKTRHQQAKVLEKRITTRIMVLLKEIKGMREVMEAEQKRDHDCYQDKVLLEQQLHALRARVDNLQPLQTELKEIKAKLASMESSINPGFSRVNVNIMTSFRPQPLLRQPQFPQLQFPQPQFLQPQFTQPQIPKPQIPQPQFLQPQFTQPQFTQPQIPKPQIPQPQFLQPQFTQPQIPKPQIPKPEIPQRQFPQPQFPQLSEGMAPIRRNKVFTVRKDPNGPIQKLQKRLQIVTRERDSYKEALEKRAHSMERAKLEWFEEILFINSRNNIKDALADSRKLSAEAEALKLKNTKLVADRDALLAKLGRAQSQTEATVQDGSGSCAGSEEAQQLKEQ